MGEKLGEILNIIKIKNFRYYLESGYSNKKPPFETRDIIDGFDNLVNIHSYI
jgi:hypothetical protein